MSPQSSLPPDLLEQAHLAFLQGHLGQARSLLDRLVIAEPENAPAQDLRATVIAKQAALMEAARLQAGSIPNRSPQAQTGSIWTRPVSDPVSTLLNSRAARKWPKPILLIVCLLAGIFSAFSLRPKRYYISWKIEIAVGLAAGVALFVWMVKRK